MANNNHKKQYANGTQNGSTNHNGHHNGYNGQNGHDVDVDVFEMEELGDNHVGTSLDTPMREDAFAMDDDQKMELIERPFPRDHAYHGSGPAKTTV